MTQPKEIPNLVEDFDDVECGHMEFLLLTEI